MIVRSQSALREQLDERGTAGHSKSIKSKTAIHLQQAPLQAALADRDGV
jgi:hypothetical protein